MSEPQEDFSQFGGTVELFNQWRSPRFGERNPTRLDNPVWEWLIGTRHSAYTAAQVIGAPSPFEAGPGWCFVRFGQSCTDLPDGRKVYIAGEHEDYYDPDFYIYNDVVVESPDGAISIYGYPRKVFPPTDFHSATLVGSEIVLIGNLGYPDDRKPGATQVLSLDINSFSVSRRVTAGDMPGWIHDHQAVLSEDGQSILVTGGKIDRGPGDFLLENLDDWRLNLKSGTWEHTTHRNWPRWAIFRSDKQPNYLWQIRQALWNLEVGWQGKYAEDLSERKDALGKSPDVRAVEELYRPPIPHTLLPEREDEYSVYRIQVEGTIVRYVEEHVGIQITVEGDLPEATVHQLVEDARSKLSALENIECHAAQLA